MKVIGIPLLAALTATWILVLANQAGSASLMMQVQVKSGDVRETPSFLGSVVSHVSYGDQVEVLEQKGAWMKVRTPAGVQGWMHESTLTRKRASLKAGKTDEKLPVSGDELALASKGFGAEFEAELRKGRTDVDYAGVDRMERLQVSPGELAAFLKQGGLYQGSGGAP